MFRSVVNTAIAVAATASLLTFATAASSHSIRHGTAGHAKHAARVILPGHPDVGVPVLDAQNGWYSGKSLNAPAPAMVAAATQPVDLSLCRMTAYLPDYAAAFESVCSKGSELAAVTSKKIFQR
jgi:hypothetical protein